MLGFFSPERNKVRLTESQLKELISIALVDGNFHANEAAFLDKIASRQNISQDKLREIALNSQDIKLMIPKSERERFDQLYLAVKMMTIDNHVHDSEVDFCQELAVLLKFRSEKSEKIVRLILQKIHAGLSEDESYEELKGVLS